MSGVAIFVGVCVVVSVTLGVVVSRFVDRFAARLFNGDDAVAASDYPSEHGDGEIDDRWPWRGP
jgi:hypothetical protein